MMSNSIAKTCAWFIILLVTALTLLMVVSGCGASRKAATKTTEAVTVTVDSQATDKATEVTRESEKETDREVKDTTIGVAGGDVRHQGDQDTVIKKGNVTLKVWTDNKGRRHTECKADSLTLVVRGLIRERMTWKRTVDSMAFASSYRKDSGSSRIKTELRIVEKKVSGAGWLKVAMWLLIAFVAGMAFQKYLIPVLKRFYSWQILNK